MGAQDPTLTVVPRKSIMPTLEPIAGSSRTAIAATTCSRTSSQAEVTLMYSLPQLALADARHYQSTVTFVLMHHHLSAANLSGVLRKNVARVPCHAGLSRS